MRIQQVDTILSNACLLVAFVCIGAITHADEAREHGKRARPPRWTSDVVDMFFEDARDTLVGSRPDFSRSATIATSTDVPAANGVSSGSASPTAIWSKIIAADTIETEIKRRAQAVGADVATPSQFKGGAYKRCRTNFSVLAMLFAVAAEYDGNVRWSDTAPALRDALARAGYNCKVGTDQTYREALQRSQDLAELIRGSRPQLPAADPEAHWGRITDRPPLMQRLELAHQERLTKWLANERLFHQNRDDIRHEAQLVAAIAHVIGREGFEYSDDEDYAQYARDLSQAASEIAAAADTENFQQAQQAISRTTNACTNCHEGYRG